MAVSFNKEVISEAIQEVLAETVSQMYVTPTNKKDIKDALKKKGVADTSAVDKAKPGEVIAVEEDHHENPNDDSDMAKSQLYAIAKYALELLQTIKDGDPLDAWVQAKITKASDYIDAVQHYLEGEEYLDANQGEPEEEAVSEDLNSPQQKRLKAFFDKLDDETLYDICDDLYHGMDMSYGESDDYKKWERAKRNVTRKRLITLAMKASIKNNFSITHFRDELDITEEDVIDENLHFQKRLAKLAADEKAKRDKNPRYAAPKSDAPKEKSAFEKRLEKLAAAEKERRANHKEDTLDEIKKAEFEKIKPGKELQLRGYGVVKVVSNDGIVMKIKDSLDKVHTINLGQYNEKFLKEDEEIDDSNFSKKDAKKEKGFAAQSAADQKKAARKKALQPILDKLEKAGVISREGGKLKVNDMDAYKKAIATINEAIDQVLSESKATCCGKCGRTHVKGTTCKRPFLTGKDHCSVR